MNVIIPTLNFYWSRATGATRIQRLLRRPPKTPELDLGFFEETMMKQPIATAIIAAIFLASLPINAALAQESAGDGNGGKDKKINLGIGNPDANDFHGRFGVGAGIAPDYEGSDESGLTVLPLADVTAPGGLFLKGASVNPNDGLASAGLPLLNLDYSEGSRRRLRLSVGPLVRYRGGRDEDDSDTLAGLGDIDPSIEVGGFMEVQAGIWSAEATAAQDVSNGHDGFLITFGTKAMLPASDNLTISAGLSTSWADGDYTQNFFGVTGGQAVRRGHARFDGNEGFKDLGIQIGASYAVSESWSLDGQLGYQRLLNDAADSPLVDKAGSPDQVRALVGIAYRF